MKKTVVGKAKEWDRVDIDATGRRGGVSWSVISDTRWRYAGSREPYCIKVSEAWMGDDEVGELIRALRKAVRWHNRRKVVA